MNATRGLEPATFRTEAIDPVTDAFNKQVEERLRQMPPINSVPVQQMREARLAGRGPFGPILLVEQAKDISVPGPAGDITIRTFVPETVRGLFLHIHGGGWTIGGADMQDPLLWDLAQTAEVAVASVEYRLAPEHPYPAGPDDCEAAATWVVQNAATEFGTDRIVIGGESAGAHLAVVTMLRLRDRAGYRDFAGAVLSYGCYDLSGTPSVRRWGDRNLILSGPIMEWFFNNFLGELDRSDPDISPLYADLWGLPPALFSVGTLDPLLDDSLFMHARWTAAGNESELAVYPGGLHAFNSFPIPLAKEANDRIAAFIRERVAAGGDRA